MVKKRMPKEGGLYLIEVKKGGRWIDWDVTTTKRDAIESFNDAKRMWNNVRIRKGKRIIKKYRYSKKR